VLQFRRAGWVAEQERSVGLSIGFIELLERLQSINARDIGVKFEIAGHSRRGPEGPQTITLRNLGLDLSTSRRDLSCSRHHIVEH